MSNSAVPMEQTESDPPLRDQIPTWLAHTHWLNADVNHHSDYKFCLDIINCCSVCNKQPELEAVIAFDILEFVIGTKSDLDNSFLNAEVFPSHYNVYIYRWDRNIQEVVSSFWLSLFLQSSSSTGLIWVCVHLKHTQDIILRCFTVLQWLLSLTRYVTSVSLSNS